MKLLLPEGWDPPRGYANGIEVEGGRFLFLAGQVGWNAHQEFESDIFTDQFRQTLENIVALLAEGSAEPRHIVRMTWYLTDKSEYLQALREVGGIYVEVMGRHFPAMSVVEVSALMEDRAKVEIEVTAVLPPTAS